MARQRKGRTAHGRSVSGRRPVLGIGAAAAAALVAFAAFTAAGGLSGPADASR